MHRQLCYIQHGLRSVFSQKKYVFFVCILTAIIFALIIMFPNAGIITDTLFASELSIKSRFVFLYASLLGVTTSFTFLSAFLALCIAFLISLNISVLARLFWTKQKLFTAGDSIFGATGILAGILGVGCAACGSILLASLFGFLGIGGALALLPLHGAEFSFIAIALLLATLAITARRLGRPNVCAVV